MLPRWLESRGPLRASTWRAALPWASPGRSWQARCGFHNHQTPPSPSGPTLGEARRPFFYGGTGPTRYQEDMTPVQRLCTTEIKESPFTIRFAIVLPIGSAGSAPGPSGSAWARAVEHPSLEGVKSTRPVMTCQRSVGHDVRSAVVRVCVCVRACVRGCVCVCVCVCQIQQGIRIHSRG